jgi:hypothetical protein
LPGKSYTGGRAVSINPLARNGTKPVFKRKENSMGQAMSSTGGARQKGASAQRRNQPEVEPGQKRADQGNHHPAPGKTAKPEGGADQSPRSVR